MRIISGSFRGKKIFEPSDSKTRPLKDLTKESIFNIMRHSNKFLVNLSNANVLDAFSGVGSFGLECLSIGVNNVVFIENYKQVLLILKKNLLNLKSITNFEIIEDNAYEINTLANINQKFDIIFLDPPYKDKNLSILLNNIKTINLLNKNGIIILHRHKKSKDIFPDDFKILEEKNYGISKIIFMTYLN